MNEVALIAGGTGGIGRGMIKALASPDRKIYFTYRSNRTEAEAILAEYPGCPIEALHCDVKSMESVRAMVDVILDKEEGIDTLINAFGITADRPLVLMDEDTWHDVINTNLNGVFNVTRCVVFSMMKRKRGNILNLSSVSGLHGLAGQTNYSASKAAIVGFSKALAKELAPKNIRVNVIAPGFVETALTDKLTPEYKDKMRTQIPLARLGEVEDLVALTRLLTSTDSSYITGQVFTVDGGLFI